MLEDEWLHDLEADPDELVNVATDPRYAEVLQALRLRTRERVDAYGGPVRGSLIGRDSRL